MAIARGTSSKTHRPWRQRPPSFGWRESRGSRGSGESTMTRATLARGAFASLVVVLAGAALYRALSPNVHRAAAKSPAIPPPLAAAMHPASESYDGFLYGRMTTVDGTA